MKQRFTTRMLIVHFWAHLQIYRPSGLEVVEAAQPKAIIDSSVRFHALWNIVCIIIHSRANQLIEQIRERPALVFSLPEMLMPK
jgi:hypothetical protein